MTELRASDDVIAKVLEFTILTAVRTNEAVGATWSEFNLEARAWTVPVERLKRLGEEADGSHTIPLSDRAVEIVRFLDAIRSGDRVFPVSDKAMLRDNKCDPGDPIFAKLQFIPPICFRARRPFVQFGDWWAQW